MHALELILHDALDGVRVRHVSEALNFVGQVAQLGGLAGVYSLTLPFAVSARPRVVDVLVKSVLTLAYRRIVSHGVLDVPTEGLYVVSIRLSLDSGVQSCLVFLEALFRAMMDQLF